MEVKLAYLGIDIGTSACKALVLGKDGNVLASYTSEYGLDQPQPGWTEQNPRVWIKGAKEAISGALSKIPNSNISALGLSGQMHGLTPIDKTGNVIRPAILWNDQRNSKEAAEIEALVGGTDKLLKLTNNRMLIGYTGGKILWMQKHEPNNFEKIHIVLNPKDYLRFVLTGEFATEVSDASGTGLFDVFRRTWSDGLLDKLSFDKSILPKAFESDIVTGQISDVAAKAFSLPRGIPVIGGGGDAVIQTLGSGVIKPGNLQTTIGTAGIVAAALKSPQENYLGRLQVFCNLAPDLWHVMGVSLNAGGALNWLRTILGSKQSFSELVETANKTDPGASGLLFLPYLNGERCPNPDPEARGTFWGLTTHHTSGHLVRSVMEGVVFSIYEISSLINAMGIETNLVKASGGGTRSELWRQMQADIFNCPVSTTKGASEGAAFGAALLSGVSQKNWDSIDEATNCCSELTRNMPLEKNRKTYSKAYEIYSELYDKMKPSFRRLSEITLSK